QLETPTRNPRSPGTNLNTCATRASTGTPLALAQPVSRTNTTTCAPATKNCSGSACTPPIQGPLGASQLGADQAVDLVGLRHAHREHRSRVEPQARRR